MSLWHRHLWRETSRQFQRSSLTVDGPYQADGANGVVVLRELAFGVTVVELRCKVCGDVKAVRYVGDSGNRGAQA